MNLSLPTKGQIVHGLERAVAVFVVAVIGYLKVAHDPASKASATAAILAGATAVWQLVLSTVTDL